MQASSSAREILDARGRVEAISEGRGFWASCGLLRAAALHARHPESHASTLTGRGAAVVLRDAP